MPTNILRNAPRRQPESDARKGRGLRVIVIAAGRNSIRAQLCDTPTADRLWAALPLFSTAERWGDSLHFEVPIESGRERGARLLGQPGEIYYWSEQDRILLVFGPTPVSRPGELRLPCPCNVLATTGDDLASLGRVTPGEKVTVRRGDKAATDRPSPTD